jgi:sulfite reductase alpha subunit-like flavoprotein
MGLGDTSYEQFNEMAVSSDNCMAKMGASRLYELGAANAETYQTEDDFIKWKTNLWSFLFDHFGKQETTEMQAEAQVNKATK